MKNINETQNYKKNYRLIFTEKGVKAYNEKTDIIITEPICFDSKKETFSAVDHFACAITCEILLCISNHAKIENQTILDLESKTIVEIKNPLTTLNVIGYDDIPSIENLSIKIYAYSFLEQNEAIAFFNRALKKCVLYNTLKNKINLKIDFELSL